MAESVPLRERCHAPEQNDARWLADRWRDCTLLDRHAVDRRPDERGCHRCDARRDQIHSACVGHALLLAFTAAALWQLFPNPFTRWQRQNRRYLGVSFALSHFVHLGAILALGVVAPDQLAALTQPKSWILGGLAYVLIAAMTATSFDKTAKAIGPKAWALIHTVGACYIWLVFANSYISRATKMPMYIVPAAAVVLALVLRIVAWKRRRQIAAAATPSAESPLA